jgi:hypothetical protein
MEIVYLPMKKRYTASVYIAPEEQKEAEQMRQDLLRWADAQDKKFAPKQLWQEERQESFCCATLQEAVSRLLFVPGSF